MTRLKKNDPMESRTLYDGHGAWVGNICFHEWTHGEGDRLNHACELMFHTDFGSYAHAWLYMGCPMKEFLSNLSMDYTMKKLAGADLMAYSDTLSIRNAREHILQARKDDDCTLNQAREAWDALDEYQSFGEGTPETMREVLDEHPNVFGHETYEYLQESTKVEHVMFFENVWVPFVKHLLEEA
jgi:hypothetical protein